jgi:hypothetical protein
LADTAQNETFPSTGLANRPFSVRQAGASSAAGASPSRLPRRAATRSGAVKPPPPQVTLPSDRQSNALASARFGDRVTFADAPFVPKPASDSGQSDKGPPRMLFREKTDKLMTAAASWLQDFKPLSAADFESRMKLGGH